MADQATARVKIAAPLDEVLATLTDFERYPEFFRDIKETVVESTDDEGRGVDVAFRTAAMGRSTRYRLRYDHSVEHRLSWVLMSGDVMRKLDGYYQLEDHDGDTEVEYSLVVDLVVPLPGFVKRRAEAMIMKAALPELKARVEDGTG
jgi:carbon monoxide dehydrogenase subunit G